MEQPPQDPAQAEQYWLDALERESAKVSPSLTALIPADRQASVAQLQRAVDYAHTVEAWYLTIVPTAKMLADGRFGRLLARVNELLAQIRLSRSTCENMPLARIAAQQASFESQPPPAAPAAAAAHNDGPAREWAAYVKERDRKQAEFEKARAEQEARFEGWQEAHRKQQEMWDAQNKAWSERFNQH